MLPIAYLVKVAIPDYLAGLPIPDTIGGWFRLGCKYLRNYFHISKEKQFVNFTFEEKNLIWFMIC